MIHKKGFTKIILKNEIHKIFDSKMRPRKMIHKNDLQKIKRNKKSKSHHETLEWD